MRAATEIPLGSVTANGPAYALYYDTNSNTYRIDGISGVLLPPQLLQLDFSGRVSWISMRDREIFFESMETGQTPHYHSLGTQLTAGSVDGSYGGGAPQQSRAARIAFVVGVWIVIIIAALGSYFVIYPYLRTTYAGMVAAGKGIDPPSGYEIQSTSEQASAAMKAYEKKHDFAGKGVHADIAAAKVVRGDNETLIYVYPVYSNSGGKASVMHVEINVDGHGAILGSRVVQ